MLPRYLSLRSQKVPIFSHYQIIASKRHDW